MVVTGMRITDFMNWSLFIVNFITKRNETVKLSSDYVDYYSSKLEENIDSIAQLFKLRLADLV